MHVIDGTVAKRRTEPEQPASDQGQFFSDDFKKLAMEAKQEAVSQIDVKDVDQFRADGNAYIQNLSNGYNSMTWADAADTSGETRRQRESSDMAIRSNQVRAWAEANKDRLDPDSYQQLITDLDNFNTFQQDIAKAYKMRAKEFQRFDSQESYDNAVREAGYWDKYGNMTKQQLETAANSLPDGEEKNWVKIYKFSALRNTEDYEYEIAVAKWKRDRLKKIYDQYKFYSKNPVANEFVTNYEKAHPNTSAELEALDNRIYQLEKGRDYSLLYKNKDFAAESKYKGDGLTVDDRNLYDLVNSPEAADAVDNVRHVAHYLDPITSGIVDAFTYENIHLMTEDERKIFNYLHNTKGEDAAEEYMDYLQATLNARSQAKVSQWVSDRVNDSWVAAGVLSTLSTPLKFMSGEGLLDVMGQKVINSFSDEYKPVDYNRDAFFFSTAGNTIRSATAQKITDATGGVIHLDEDEHPYLAAMFNGKGMGDIYNLSMSMQDSAVVAIATAINPIAGKVASTLLSASAATDTMLMAAANGASDGQAITLGLAAGFFEWFFEKYEIGSLMKQGTNVVTAMLKQGFNEFVGEGATELCNMVVNSYVLAENSDWQKNIDAYLQAHPEWTEERARKQAWMDAVSQVLSSAAAGFLSGSMMGGSMAVINTIQANHNASKTYGDNPGMLVQTLLTKDPQNALGLKMQQKLDDGKTLSGGELRKVAEQLAATQEIQTPSPSVVDQMMEGIEPVGVAGENAPVGNAASYDVSGLVDDTIAELTGAPSNPVAAAVEGFRETGTVSNKQVTHILNNASAVEQLVQETGMVLPETASGKRNAVKEAVVKLAEQNRQETAEESVDLVDTLPDETQGMTNSETAQPLANPVQPIIDPAQEDPVVDVPAPAVGTEETATESVGAAPEGFTGKGDFYNLMTDENAQPDRPGDVRPMEIPKTDAYGRHVSEFAANAYGAEVTTDRSADMIQELIAEGALGFDSRSNKDLLEKANERIKKRGMANVEKQINNAVFKNKATDEDIAAAMILYAKYSQKSDTGSQDRAAELVVDLATMANEAGRRLQLFGMLRKMTPEGQLMVAKKIVQREQDQVNRKRGKKKAVEVYTPQQLQDDFLAAARDALSETGAATSYISALLESGFQEDSAAAARTATESVFGEATASEAGLQTNDLAEQVGQRVADALTRKAEKQETSVENILYQEMMRFANDKASLAGKTNKRASDKNMKTLQDYYRYRAFFQTAWDNARARVQQAMNSMAADDVRREHLYAFLNSATVENDSPVSVSFDYGNPKSTLRRGAKEAATAAGYRMENASFDAAGTELSTEVQRQMKDVLLENWEDQQKAADEIVRVAMEGLSLTEEQAAAMARDITEAFFADLADRGAKRLSRMFTTKETAQKVQKSFSQKLKELYNLGAFSNEDYRQAAFDLLFGEGSDIDIPDTLMQQFVEASEDRKGAALEAIYQNAAAQMPATFWEKANAWRYMSMLGNARTQVRNFAGSATMRPMVNAKRVIGAAIERVALDQENRTKAVLGFSKDSKELLAWAKEDARAVSTQEVLKRSGLAGDNARSKIQDYRKIYNTQWLEATREFVQLVPEAVDMLFKKREYAVSLASFLKARGYTRADIADGKISDEVLMEARDYAAQEAMKATFNDSNALSDFLSRRLAGDNRFERAVNLVVEGILPFRRTPANILVRSLEYGPAGLVRGFTNLATKVRRGEMSAATAIDQIAAGLTGCGMIGLGFALAAGIIPGIRLRGKISDDEEKDGGHQEYALEIGGISFTIDWAAPVCMPLFIGANIHESYQNPDEDAGFLMNVVDACGNSLEPLLELSCLSSLSDLLEDAKYADAGDQIYSIAASVATSYLGQYIPSILGQAERAFEADKKKVYSDADTATGRTIEEFIGGVTQKIPGIDLFQAKKYDQQGDDNSTANRVNGIGQFLGVPGNMSVIDKDSVLDEISRLNDVQAENVSLPSTKSSVSYVDTSGVLQDRRMTQEEYEAVSHIQGQTQDALLQELIASDDYKALSDTQKAKAMEDVYAYAKETAYREGISDYRGNADDAWMIGIDGQEISTIIPRRAANSVSSSLTALTDAWKSGFGEKDAIAAMDEAYATFSGLSDTAAEAVLGEIGGGKNGAFIAAREAGMTSEVFSQVYKTYYNLEKTKGLTVSEKAQKWAYELDNAETSGLLTADQKAVLKERLGFRASMSVDAGKYDEMIEAGVSASTADYVSTLLRDIQPEDGKSNVRDIQKMEAIVEDGQLSDEDVKKLLPLYLSTGAGENYETALAQGYDSEDFIDAYRIWLDKERGTQKNAVIRQIAAETGISYTAAKRLYGIITE